MKIFKILKILKIRKFLKWKVKNKLRKIEFKIEMKKLIWLKKNLKKNKFKLKIFNL